MSYISEAESPIVYQRLSSRDHSIVSGINYILETLPLLYFLDIRLLLGIGDNAHFHNMIDCVSHVVNMRNIWRWDKKDLYTILSD